MVTLMDEMTGRELLIADGEAAELEPKTCLVCSAYQFRDKGHTIICAKRLKVEIPVSAWGRKEYGRSKARAQRCTKFSDMRGN